MLETIILAIIAAAPSITAIAGIIAAVVKIIKSGKDSSKVLIDKFEEVRQEVMDTKEYENLKQELKIAHQENRELKQKINELLTKIDCIARDSEN